MTIILFFTFSYSKAQTADWLISTGPDPFISMSQELSSDDTKNIYFSNSCLYGFCWEQICYGTSPSTEIVKADSQGHLIWHYSLSYYITIFDIEADNSGGVYCAGVFTQDTLILNGDTLFDNSVYSSGIILKINSSGQLEWYKPFYSTDQVRLRSISLINSNRIGFTGFYSSNMQVDTIQKSNSSFSFYLEMDSTGTFNFIRYTGSYSTDIGINSNGSVLTGCSFLDVIANDDTTITLIPDGKYDYLFTRYDSLGNRLETHVIESVPSACGFEVLPNNRVILSGGFRDTLIFESDTLTTIAGSPGYDMFLVKMDLNTGHPLHAIGLGSSRTDNLYSCDANGNYNFLLAGSCDSAIQINGSSYPIIGSESMFIASFDSSLQLNWIVLPDSNPWRSATIAVECMIDNSTIGSGFFYSSVLSINNLSAITSNNEGTFVVHVTDFTTKISGLYEEESYIQIYPNPASDNVLIASSNSASELKSVQLFTSDGQLVLSRNLEYGLFSVHDISNGYYLLKIILKDKIIFKRLIILH